MNVFDFLADAGLAGTGFEKARRTFEKDARDKALEELRIAAAQRQAQEQIYQQQAMEGLRRVAAETGIMGAQPDQTATVPTRYKDGLGLGEMPGNEPVPMDVTLQGAPGGLNKTAQARAMADYARGKVMDPKLTGDLEKSADAAEKEGYVKFLNGILAGKPVAEVMDGFNNTGNQRILGGIKNEDGSYSFKYDDGSMGTIGKREARALGEAAGIFKRGVGRVLHPGDILTSESGEVLAKGEPKQDPLTLFEGKEAIRQRNRLAALEYKQALGIGAGGSQTAKSKDFELLKEVYGRLHPDWDESQVEQQALTVAYNIHQRGKSKEDRIRLWMGQLRMDPQHMMSSTEELRAAATKFADSFGEPDAGGAPAPKPAPATPKSPNSALINTPQAAQGQYTGPSGRVYRWQDVIATARKSGMTTNEVIDRLGLVSEGTP